MTLTADPELPGPDATRSRSATRPSPASSRVGPAVDWDAPRRERAGGACGRRPHLEPGRPRRGPPDGSARPAAEPRRPAYRRRTAAPSRSTRRCRRPPRPRGRGCAARAAAADRHRAHQPAGPGPAGPARRPAPSTSTRCSSRCSASCAQTHPKADLRLLEQAYEVAERQHRGQLRKSGDPYITHPLAVATILAELGMTPPTLCAALLHDTVEDTAVHARAAARGLRRRGRRTSSTASPSSTRSSTARRRRPRPSARWSSRWPATSGCWSSSSPTGCTTCARCATSSRRRSRSRRPARRSRSTRRWPTGSA